MHAENEEENGEKWKEKCFWSETSWFPFFIGIVLLKLVIRNNEHYDKTDHTVNCKSDISNIERKEGTKPPARNLIWYFLSFLFFAPFHTQTEILKIF